MHNYFSLWHFSCFRDDFIQLQMVKYINNTGGTNFNQLQHAISCPKNGYRTHLIWSICIHVNARKIAQWEKPHRQQWYQMDRSRKRSVETGHYVSSVSIDILNWTSGVTKYSNNLMTNTHFFEVIN